MLLSDLARPIRLALYSAASTVVLFLCLTPSAAIPGSGLIWDKAAHALTWALLAVIGFILGPKRPVAIVVFCLCLGAAIEVAQSAMGLGRQGDWRDLLADCIGVTIAAFGRLAIRALRARGEP
jgi:VanZ family protein